MIVSFQGKNNAGEIARIEKGHGVIALPVQAYIGVFNEHKFKPGQEVRLTGLQDYPEFNGELVTITSIREDGARGRAYYFKTDNPDLADQLNWVYEFRLRAA